MNKSITLNIYGDGGVGKTTWVNRWVTGNFNPKYIIDDEVKTYNLHFPKIYNGLSSFDVEINVMPGTYKFVKPYQPRADATIIMFDLSNKKSFKNVEYWKKYSSGITVICGNKFDTNYNPEYIKLTDETFFISSKTMYQHEHPLMYIFEQLS